jgi:hypothetical protein
MSRATQFGSPASQILGEKRKAKLMNVARRCMHTSILPPTVPRLTATHVEIFGALLWRFHNDRIGQCYPSLSTIADWVGCAVDTVCEALRRLERFGLISWTHRIRRIVAPVHTAESPVPTRTRVVRTSNAYQFHEPRFPISEPPKPKASFNGKQCEQRNALIEPSPIGRQQNKNTFLPITNWLNERIQEAIRGRNHCPS